jgi:hypothetical protein
VLAAVAVPVIMAVMVLVPMNRAVATRTDLETTYGPQESYVPPASGIPAPERIEAFLEVRRALEPACEDFWTAERSVAKLEALDDQEDVSKIVAIRQAFSTSKTMMGVGSLIADFYETRNRALLSAGMGLGEYTYLYVLAYNDQITHPTEELNLFGPEVVNQRVHNTLLTMLKNQLALQQSESPSADATAGLASEIEAVEHDRRRIPWQDGLPPEIERGLTPYRQELDASFCAATSPLELMINEKRALAIETR